MGGATVMPYLKLKAPSVRGTALFWKNLRHNGDDEFLTKHAGCPVLMGMKTVMNKWIRSFGQEFRRPCENNDYEEKHQNEIYKQLM